MPKSRALTHLPLVAPGYNIRRDIALSLEMGRMIRDDHLWQYPTLPGAVYTYQQMASGREWSVTGSVRGSSRAVEYLNGAYTILADGTVDFGFEQFLRRRALDYLSLGRVQFLWRKGELRYLDPVDITFYLDRRKWIDRYTNEEYFPSEVMTTHPIPIGNDGYFVSPLSFVIPTAILAWLIREHDKASADGRKIRDILLVHGKDLADQIVDAAEESLALWSGEVKASENGIPVVHADIPPGMKASDLISRLGIANIPEGFSRADFQFEYVNEIAAAIGISLRHFWNSEKATNRALEEVQEARQTQKGPSAFVRSEQRLLNSGCLLQFGRSTRMTFNEEVDAQSQEIRAKVLKMYSEALVQFAKVFGAQVNGDAFLAWLQSEDILPADLDLLTEVGNIQRPDRKKVPDGKDERIANPDSPAPSKTEKSVSPLDYDEITMNQDGIVIERRLKVISFERILKENLVKNKAFRKKVIEEERTVNFRDALDEARERNSDKFFDLFSKKTWNSKSEDYETVKSIVAARESLTDDNHRMIKRILDKIS